MKLVFVSNYFNHHQRPFCDEMFNILGDNFIFISTEKMSEERKKLGYSDKNTPAYVIDITGDEKKRDVAQSLINNADVVIAGSASSKLIRKRIAFGKIVLHYAERPFKIKPSFFRRMYHYVRFRFTDGLKKNVFMLCTGGFAALDYRNLGIYNDRMYKWGYFPAAIKYDVDELINNKTHNSILWCGRFIDWKHPDDAVRLAVRLKASGYDFHLTMVGSGYMEKELKEMAEANDVSDTVTFTGSMPPNMVRRKMEESSIFLQTSDRQEGWGAVLNEAMNSGCAVVASNEIGSASYLVRHKENALLYESGNIDSLTAQVEYLLRNSAEQRRIGAAAYNTITELWNARIAAERLMILIEKLQSCGACDVFPDGPCSRA